jgi:hypothetical protein
MAAAKASADMLSDSTAMAMGVMDRTLKPGA